MLIDAAAWDLLRDHGRRLASRSLESLVRGEPGRVAAHSLTVGPVHASFARQHVDAEAWSALRALAESAGVRGAMASLMEGEQVNATEHRAALHTALRGDAGRGPAARAARAEALAARERMDQLHAGLAAGPVTDIVHVGIGGSDLGPRLVVDALREAGDGRFRVHFLSNVDGSAAQRVLAGLDPARTAALLVSKSFGTQETLLNGRILREWLGDDSRLFAITARAELAAAFGIEAARVLPMWDWVGGRFSLWSPVGLVAQLAIGRGNFEALLAGAAAMDVHVRDAPVGDNLAVRHALFSVWNRSVLGLGSQAVMPYDGRLALLPAYLQQLLMESLGKSVRVDGSRVVVPTAPIVWGGAGSDVQHSFFQALHQGSERVALDFIGCIRPAHPHADNHRALLANLFAQAEALANGASAEDPHRRYAGGRPSTMLLLDELTPASLGALLAMYEHSTYVQSVLWGLNAFDQWGVELGKRIATDLLPALCAPARASDPITRSLLLHLQKIRGGDASG